MAAQDPVKVLVRVQIPLVTHYGIPEAQESLFFIDKTR